MQILDFGIIVSKRLLEENSGIITVFTKEHGLYSGVAKNLTNSKGSNIYQIGNLVDFTWSARLPTHVGTLKCELMKSYSAKILHDKTKLYFLSSILSIISASLKPHEKYPDLFDHVNSYLANLTQNYFSLLAYIKAEMSILSEVGYSLDLSKCAVTGSTENLIYISPKSGKAASSSAGEPYSSQLLPLPSFLLKNIEPESETDIKLALDLTGYFFKRYIFHNGLEPVSREILCEYAGSLGKNSGVITA
jgi:DNA repair protein RecO (recombination protein O)